MSQHLDVTLPIIMASLLLGWTWLAERWQRYHRRHLTAHTHTDRAINRTIRAQERAQAQVRTFQREGRDEAAPE